MAETIDIARHSSKAEKYASLLPQLEALTSGEPDFLANLSNIIAVLKEAFGFFWIGNYFVKSNELVLGTFQGPLACTRIGFGKGVCGKSWEKKEVIIVPDVNQFEGHIACSSASKSEIVLPAFNKKGDVFMVLDIDSDKLDDFDQTDKINLQKIMLLIENLYNK